MFYKIFIVNLDVVTDGIKIIRKKN